MNSWQKLFERKFRPVFREIEFIDAKILQKDGFLSFEWYRYGVEEFHNSEHFIKIESILRKIEDDVIHWSKRREISEEGRMVYEEKIFQVEEALHQLKIKILYRQPTRWERFSIGFIIWLGQIHNNFYQVRQISHG